MEESYYVRLVFKTGPVLYIERFETRIGNGYIFKEQKLDCCKFKSKEDCDSAIMEFFEQNPAMVSDIDHTEVIVG